MQAIYSLPIIAGPVPWIVYGLAAALALYLLLRRPTPRWVLTAPWCSRPPARSASTRSTA